MSAILGLGLDLVEVERLGAALARHGARFEARLCRPGEIRPLVGRARVAHVAGLFAAKEAVMKALGTGWSSGVGFRQIEIVHTTAGAPEVRLHDEAALCAARLGVTSVRLSITHDGGMAAAVALLEARGSES